MSTARHNMLTLNYNGLFFTTSKVQKIILLLKVKVISNLILHSLKHSQTFQLGR